MYSVSTTSHQTPLSAPPKLRATKMQDTPLQFHPIPNISFQENHQPLVTPDNSYTTWSQHSTATTHPLFYLDQNKPSLGSTLSQDSIHRLL